MKKLLIISLVLVACIAAKAASWTDTNGTVWSFNYSSWNGNKATITSGISGTIPANLVIPSTVYIDETAYNVTSIGSNAFKDRANITSVTIPDGVTSIGSQAFSGCITLASVTISESVTSIEPYAFQDCSSLASIVIPDGVTALNNGIFSGCTKLTSVTIPEGITSIGSHTFYQCSSLSSINIPDGVTSIGESAFWCCSSLSSINIPEGITSLDRWVFYGCSSLTSINIPDGVTLIKNDAFGNCSSLKKVIISDLAAWCGINFGNTSSNPLSCAHHLYSDENTEITNLVIPEGVTSIGNYAFDGASGLTSVSIPESVTSLSSTAFSGCSGITSIILSDGLTSIPNNAFSSCTNLTSVNIPATVTSIGNSAFYGCYNLKKVIISDLAAWCGINLGNAYSNPLYYARHLYSDENTEITNLVIPEGVTTIGSSLFDGCSSLTSITIPESVTSIGTSAFSYCTGLKKVIIPDLVAWCGINFGNTSSNPLSSAHHLYSDENTEITNLVIPEGATVIGNSLFSGCSGLTSITIPEGVTSIGTSAFSQCTGLTSITIPESVTSIGTSAFQGCSNLTSVTIPNGLTIVENDVFHGCSSLTSITIPESVTSIGTSAFQGCSNLTSVTIPNGLTIVENDVFHGCSSLTSITIPESVTSIGSSAFSQCTSLTSVTIPNGVTSIGDYTFQGCSGLTSVTIPNGVTSIGNYTFQGCSGLTSVTIPNGVTNIGACAFYGCTGLTSITIPESVTSIGNYAFYDCSGLNSIIIPENVTSIGNYAFDYCSNLLFIHFASATPKLSYSWPSIAFLYVPDESVDAYKAAWTSFANHIFPESTPTLFDMTLNAKENSSDLIDQIGDANAYKVVHLKISGTFNGYDVMVMRNKMTNLRSLDMSDAHVVGNPYEYVSGYKTKDDIITGYFLPTGIVSVKLPEGITALEVNAFKDCGALKSIELPATVTSIGNGAFTYCSSLTSIIIPEGVTSIGGSAFFGCSNLASVIIPDCVTLIGSSAFYNCHNLSDIHLPKMLRVIGSSAFYNTHLTELHLPPFIESIGSGAFGNCSSLKKIYAYMPGIIPIGSSTFNNYKQSELYIPEFLYNNYYYDTNWSQFISINKTSLSPDDYVTLPTNDDLTFADGEERIPDTSEGEHVDAEIGDEGGVTVEGDEPQPFDEVEQSLDGNGQGGSLIGEDDGENQGNLPVNTLNVKIQVKAGRWYFFCFPFDVTIAECEYPGQYAWREYDGLIRALQGANGWKNVEGETLTARKGYIFQSATAGTLVVKFDKPTFGGDRPKTLTEYICDNAANASWNFVGNPYSSFYDFKAEDFDAPITVWNGNSYEAYRPGDDEYHLQPYEAFFVQKPNESEKIDFKKEKRETYRQSKEKKANNVKALLLKGITPSRLLVNLNISDNDTASVDKTRLVLNEKASRNYEMTCDAAKFISNDANAQLYTVEEKVEMAINERPTEGDIRLGYKAKKAGKLTIEAPRMDLPMELVDTKTGVTFDLSLGSYEFQTEAGTFNTRFMLRPTEDATAIKDITKKTGVAIGLQNGGLSIGGAEGKDVKVFTTGGALAAQHAGNGYVGLPSGTYIVAVDGMKAKVHVK